ncbi:MAG: hypothetical protein HC879_07280 [Leptolyngbyaceae cyanobacterium SL_5_9]|nr:hypothetical protein [Leptolyngbyaceae cyanobacterium SL_5_9]NJO73180.1 hypothetical protein [Leptolyngbyaceae cyanobacterium RM1_406_9]
MGGRTVRGKGLRRIYEEDEAIAFPLLGALNLTALQTLQNQEARDED